MTDKIETVFCPAENCKTYDKIISGNETEELLSHYEQGDEVVDDEGVSDK